MVGGLNFANVPTLPHHSAFSILAASNARKMPGWSAATASPLKGKEAHRMPVPATLPFAEMDNIPPGMGLENGSPPESGSFILLLTGSVDANRWAPESNLNAFR